LVEGLVARIQVLEAENAAPERAEWLLDVGCWRDAGLATTFGDDQAVGA
jgi:hypothetical protein